MRVSSAGFNISSSPSLEHSGFVRGWFWLGGYWNCFTFSASIIGLDSWLNIMLDFMVIFGFKLLLILGAFGGGFGFKNRVQFWWVRSSGIIWFGGGGFGLNINQESRSILMQYRRSNCLGLSRSRWMNRVEYGGWFEADLWVNRVAYSVVESVDKTPRFGLDFEIFSSRWTR